MVAAQWAPTICRAPRRCTNTQRPHFFVLHGAWPVDTTNPQTHSIPDSYAPCFNMVQLHLNNISIFINFNLLTSSPTEQAW